MAAVEKARPRPLGSIAVGAAALLPQPLGSSAGPANRGPPLAKLAPQSKEGSILRPEFVLPTARTRLLADPRRCVASELESSGSTGCAVVVHSWRLLC